MKFSDVMQASFVDEITKIAGEMQGQVRSGRRPIGVERLLEKDREFSDAAMEGIKLSQAPLKSLIGAGIAGAGLYHVARKANQDRQLGRAMRIQQGAQSY